MVLAYPAFSCAPGEGGRQITADASQVEKSKSERERCKRSENSRTPGKGCTDGGERLPQDKPSPLDNIPPLSPLVA